MWRVVVVETLSGDPVSPQLEPSALSFTTGLVEVGTGQISFAGAALPEGVEDVLTRVWASTLVLMDDKSQRVFAAGIVTDWSWDGDTLTLNVSEFGVLHGLRTLNGVGATPPVQRVYRGASLRDVIVQALKVLHSWKGIAGSSWDLPVIWPQVNTTGSVMRVFEWWRFQTGQQILDELMAEDGAPIVRFRPEWVDGKLRWRCLVGTLEESRHVVPVGSAEHPVQGAGQVRVVRDGTAMRSEMWVAGNGQEAQIVWGAASVESRLPAGMPRLVAVSAWGTVEQKARADAIAAGLAGARIDSAEKWEINLLDGELLHAAEIQPGDRLEIQHPGDRLVPAGSYERIVLSVAVDGSPTVRVVVQEVATAVDRLNSGVDAVLRRLAAAETQASNRSSTTIEELKGLVARAERATKNAQDAADDAKRRADAAAREAAAAKADAGRAQASAGAANAAAAAARGRADQALGSARSAAGAASSARSAAASAHAAANTAQASANHAKSGLQQLKWRMNTATAIYDQGVNYTGADKDAILWTAGRMVANGLKDWF